ncbi:PDZ domain [Popillia japonica]|uniref:PDZ domain n=1 Tax=Popillia japonica TaxID=7064 RepID=A0AAW1LBJ0_POPJA
MSFGIKNIIKKGIKGYFCLLPQSTGRCQNVPMTTDQISNASGESKTYLQQADSYERQRNGLQAIENKSATMCESLSMEEVGTVVAEDIDDDLKKSTITNKTVLSEQQKLADENLFLRYLELDPTEGPEAIPAALQRNRTGNKNGRTPFTTTKKLNRQPKTGFGFSVVWTHPPRIERVEKGLPADRAGILPGDYIIFVDKHNVVMMPEIEILNLIRSYGNQLTLEIFRRNTSRNGSVSNVRRLTSVGTESSTPLPAPSLSTQRRPSTVYSTTNTTSVEYNRRKLQLPQVTFSSEKPTNSNEDAKKKAMYQLINKEQQYATGLQFAVTRFVSSLAERKDLITAREHKLLFQNSEELLRISEDIVDSLMPEDGEPQFHLLGVTYQSKLSEIMTAYRKYCSGIKKSDCILANKMKNSNSDFVKFLQCPAIPRRRPDITAFIHKPLEHFRDVLKLFSVILSNTKSNAEDYPVISQIVHDLQITYREITAEGGLMEPLGEGRPLLSVQDLENRLVFTKCKPFVLSKPGRHWIFGGDLSRVEGRNVRQYWALLFTDILLFAKVSRDRVLFIFEEPLSLAHITDLTFNVRKKVNEFRITVEPGGKTASSPTIHCGPDLTRTPRKNPNRRCIVLRAPTTELKAVWQNLLQRQIFHVNAGMDGSSFSSPLESPEAPITSSVVTLQSAESLSIRRQNPQSTINTDRADAQKQIDELIEHKCKQLGKTSSGQKGGAIHLEQWMKGQLGSTAVSSLTELQATPEEENVYEVWSDEMLRKRSEELKLMVNEKNAMSDQENVNRCESRIEEIIISDIDCSPSRSTTSESQVTVRSSPVVPETLTVCKQCHRTCLTNQNGASIYASNNNSERTLTPNNKPNNNPENNFNSDVRVSATNYVNNARNEDDWRPLVLMGLNAVNPATTLVNMDPFSVPVPRISILPPTPDCMRKVHNSEENLNRSSNCNCQETTTHFQDNGFSNNNNENSPDSSPQTEDQPYHSLNSSNLTLRRYGTVSSLERLGSDDFHMDDRECDDKSSQSDADDDDDDEDEDDEDDDDDLYDDDDNKGYYNEAFNHSSLRSWTARAGSFVAEKMAIFERLGEDYKAGSRFFERYLRTTDSQMNGEEAQEEETSGATSGEDVWGTPTSGGEMDDPLSSPNYDGRKSPNDDSISSNDDNTELMMDELLMTPPVTSSNIRGLLPRRTLEPLMEEEYSDTYTSSSSTSSEGTQTDPSGSSEQGNETGNAADVCSTAAENPVRQTTNFEKSGTPTPTRQSPPLPSVQEGPPDVSRDSCNSIVAHPPPVQSPKIHRSESYRHIIEQADACHLAEGAQPITFFTRLKPTIKFVNIEKIPRSKGVKLLEFFNMKRERKIHESFGTSGKHLIKVYTKEEFFAAGSPTSYTDKPLSPRRLKDKQLDRRFWKQLNKRRGQKPLQLSA